MALSQSGPWQFATDPDFVGQARGWAQPDFDDSGWVTVTVPHIWNVMPEYIDYAGIAWYRRQLTLPSVAGPAHIRLRFGAVFYLAQVWWNGIYVGEHEGGYTPFEFDVSRLARPGATNFLAVRVDNRRDMDRLPTALPTRWSYDWWHYGGIVRDVALQLSSRAYIGYQQLVAVPALAGVGRADTATLTATVTVTNASVQPLEGVLIGDVHAETGACRCWPLPPPCPSASPRARAVRSP
jgi:beta-galactosidase/beta-glucuronidase